LLNPCDDNSKNVLIELKNYFELKFNQHLLGKSYTAINNVEHFLHNY